MGKTSDVKVPPQASDSFCPSAVTIKWLDQRQKSAARRARTAREQEVDRRDLSPANLRFGLSAYAGRQRSSARWRSPMARGHRRHWRGRSGTKAPRVNVVVNVRYWHLADIDADDEHVCFWG